MTPGNLLAGGAILGLVTATWKYIKSFAWRIVSLVIQRCEITTEAVHFPVICHLLNRYGKSRIYDKVFGARRTFLRDGRFGLIPYEHFGNRALVFWKGPFPIVVSVGGSRVSGGGTNDQTDGGSAADQGVFSSITTIRGSVDVEAIVAEACAERNALTWDVQDQAQSRRRRYFIKFNPGGGEADGGRQEDGGLAWYQRDNFRLLRHAPGELGRPTPSHGSALEQLIFPERIYQLIDEVRLWRNSRDWYRERRIPWKRGWCLHGPPGTGKTALARAFAEDLDLPIFVYNLAEMKENTELQQSWRAMQSSVPCIALIEDVDSVFHGRENVAWRRQFPVGALLGGGDGGGAAAGGGSETTMIRGITFDCLLNCIDGVELNEGVFLIMTTNDISKVDDALGVPRTLPDGTVEHISTRPGRLDKAIELTYMRNEDKLEMAERILGDYPPELERMRKFVAQWPELEETPAQFQERCAQVALARYWRLPDQEPAAPAAAVADAEPRIRAVK